LNASAGAKYVNLASTGGIYHSASSSLPAQQSLPPKTMNRQQQQQQQQQQAINKDYVQIASFPNSNNNTNPQSASPSRSLNRPYSSPTKSIGSQRPVMEEINGSDYVCMSGGTLTKKLQQAMPAQQQQQQQQVVFQKSPPVPPLANINLNTNYVTPANELPKAQYSTAANQSIDAIAVAKQSVNFTNLSNSPAVSPTPSNVSAGSGKSELLRSVLKCIC